MGSPSQTERPLISNPNHPDHRLYQQAVSNLEQLGPSGGFASREALEKAAAAVAADAKASGLSDITHVSRTQGPNGQGFLVAVQGDPTNPAQMLLTTTRELLKISKDATDADVAVPAGLKAK